jgi:RNA polymerase sigma-70 factor (ECF subfamily)
MDISIHLEGSEQQLIGALVRQERWAQQQLYEACYGKMMGICLRYAGSKDEALDLLHEGFIKVFQHIGRYKPGAPLEAWIRTIMVNTCIDYFRKNMRRRTDDLEQAREVCAGGPDALSDLTEKEILAAVQELSPAYRAVFNLYAVEGYSHKEIAEALEITESTSRSNLVKARIKLRAFFALRRMEFDPDELSPDETDL